MQGGGDRGWRYVCRGEGVGGRSDEHLDWREG